MERRMTQIPWRDVFVKWMIARIDILDRIDFADVPRFPNQSGWFEYTGPIRRVDRATMWS